MVSGNFAFCGYSLLLKRFRWLFIVVFAATVFLILYFAGFHKLPHYLLYPFLISQFFLLIFYFEKFKLLPGFKQIYYLTPALFVALGIVIVTSAANLKVQNNNKSVIGYMVHHPDDLFLIQGHGIRYEGMISFTNPALNSEHNIIPTNWVINTPIV